MGEAPGSQCASTRERAGNHQALRSTRSVRWVPRLASRSGTLCRSSSHSDRSLAVGQGPGHRPANVGNDERSPILWVPHHDRIGLSQGDQRGHRRWTGWYIKSLVVLGDEQDRKLTVSPDRIGDPVGIEDLHTTCLLASTRHCILLLVFSRGANILYSIAPYCKRFLRRTSLVAQSVGIRACYSHQHLLYGICDIEFCRRVTKRHAAR